MDGKCILEVAPAELIGRLYMFWVSFMFCAVVSEPGGCVPGIKISLLESRSHHSQTV